MTTDLAPSAPITGDVLDRETAWMRHADTDGAGFLSRFAHLMVEALPRHAQLHTVSRGLFRRTTEVVGVSIGFDDAVYALHLDERGGLTPQVEKKARGIALSTRRLPMDAWMTGLMDAIRAHTREAQAVAVALRGL